MGPGMESSLVGLCLHFVWLTLLLLSSTYCLGLKVYLLFTPNPFPSWQQSLFFPLLLFLLCGCLATFSPFLLLLLCSCWSIFFSSFLFLLHGCWCIFSQLLLLHGCRSTFFPLLFLFPACWSNPLFSSSSSPPPPPPSFSSFPLPSQPMNHLPFFCSFFFAPDSLSSLLFFFLSSSFFSILSIFFPVDSPSFFSFLSPDSLSSFLLFLFCFLPFIFLSGQWFFFLLLFPNAW